MKTFGDIKEGDYIYYYDHCKLHKQLVTKVENKEIRKTYKTFDGYTEYVNNNRIIEAGKGTKLNFNQLALEYSKLNYYSMLRFADIEAYKEWVKERKDHLNKKIKYFNDKYNEYSKRLNKLLENNKEYRND